MVVPEGPAAAGGLALLRRGGEVRPRILWVRGTAATRIKIAKVILKSVLSSQLFDKNLLFIICLHLINNRNL